MTDPTLSSAPGKAPETVAPPLENQTAVLDHPQPDSPPRALQLWMHRISVFLFVLISAVAGVLLIILPWTPEWTDNYLLLSFPACRDVVSNGFFRGFCSGLGLLGLGHTLLELVHAACRINELLLAGIERVANVANADDDRGFGRTRLDYVPAGATNFRINIFRMNIRFHKNSSLRLSQRAVKGSGGSRFDKS